jgi:hypothetical protein
VDAVASTASLNDLQTLQASPIVDDTVVASKDATGVVANIELTMKNLLGSAYSTSGVFSAVISGPGLLGLDNDGTPNSVGATKVLPITFNAGKAWVTVTGDGRQRQSPSQVLELPTKSHLHLQRQLKLSLP